MYKPPLSLEESEMDSPTTTPRRSGRVHSGQDRGNTGCTTGIWTISSHLSNKLINNSIMILCTIYLHALQANKPNAQTIPSHFPVHFSHSNQTTPCSKGTQTHLHFKKTMAQF